VVALKGLEKFAPKDFPGFIASTVFVAGCNFRCPYCHNPDLILRPGTLADIPPNFFLAYLDARRGWLEGICVSGGEPLLAPGLEDLLTVIKGRDLLVKIDTNGSSPGLLAELIGAKLVDRLAFDIKAAPGRYAEVTRSEVAFEDIERSLEVVRETGLETLFRTTVVPGLVGAEDIRAISRLLSGAPVFQIQAFSPFNTLDPGLAKVKPFSREEILDLAKIARPHFDEIRVEGIR
jgi:pyruvate formate lyase activating enzyme